MRYSLVLYILFINKTFDIAATNMFVGVKHAVMSIYWLTYNNVL